MLLVSTKIDIEIRTNTRYIEALGFCFAVGQLAMHLQNELFL